MIRFSHLPACLIAAFALANASEVQASFLPPGFDRAFACDASPLEEFAEGMGLCEEAARPVEESRLPIDPPDGSDPSVLEVILFTGAGTSTGGTSPTPTSGVPGGLLAVTVCRVDGDEVIGYQTRESRCLLPVPYLSGIFRPPRG